MGLVAKLEGKSNIQLRVVKQQEDRILEFYLEATYNNGEESTAKELLHGPIVVDERGHPVVQQSTQLEPEDYVSIVRNLMTQEEDSIDISIVPALLRKLRERLDRLKAEGIQVQKVGNYTLEQVEALYS